MTTITKEFAQAIIKCHGYGVAPSAVEALARIALASFEAEAVAYADPQSFDNFKSMGGKNAACTKEWMWRDSGEGLIPLFTAPPAPVVSAEIRNGFKAEAMAELLKDAHDYAPLTAEQWETLVNNWQQTFMGLSGEGDSYRAAMLHTPSTSKGE